MSKARGFGRLYLTTLIVAGAIWLAYLLYRHIECDRRGGKLLRGVFWMECLSSGPATDTQKGGKP